MKAKLPKKKRKHQRANTAMRVFLKSATGVTRDMSASGAYFWTSGTYAIGESISFSIELKTAGGRMMRKCKGEVLRVERQDSSHVGVGVRITESRMEPT